MPLLTRSSQFRWEKDGHSTHTLRGDHGSIRGLRVSGLQARVQKWEGVPAAADGTRPETAKGINCHLPRAGVGTGGEGSRGISDKTYSHCITGKGASRKDEKKQVHTQLRNY